MKQIFTTVCCLATLAASAQNTWTVSQDPQKSFIENKSQFNSLQEVAGSEILFATEHSSTQFLFTKHGVTYLLMKKEHVAPDATERKKGKTHRDIEESEHQMKVTRDAVHMKWKNPEPTLQVIPVEKVSQKFYYKSDQGSTQANAFRKICYQSVFPLIDAEYTFHPEGGIEYSFVLHGGADPASIEMSYSGMSRMKIDAENNLQLHTIFGNVIEHAPKAYYADSKKEIPVRFIKKGKRISFELGSYDRSVDVIIDPWVVTPAMGNANKVFNIEADSAGNAYIYGGDSPYKLQKYDPSGALQWTFTNSWDSATYWCGTLIVDRAGNSYITAGSTAEITKVNTSGSQVWTNSGGFVDEYWSMAFNCDESELVVGGTRLTGLPFPPTGSGRAFNIDLNNGGVINSIKVADAIPAFFINDPNEIRSISASPDGNYYFLTLDTIGSLAPALASINWESVSGYRFNYGSPEYGFTPQGQSIIRASATHIYTANGDSVVMRDINTGVITGAAAIPGGGHTSTFLIPGTLPKNGGLAIDSCGNVYAGSQTNVTKYDSNLNFISSTPTPSAVYDVAIGNNGDVLACGNGFAAALNIPSCSQIHLDCNTAVLPVAAFSAPNSICPGTCTDFINLSTDATSYQWYFPGGQPAVSTDGNPTGICYNAPGTYDVTLVAINVSGTDSLTLQNYLTVYPFPPPQGILQYGDTLMSNQGSTSYQWYHEGVLIPGATDYFYVMTEGGNYNVVCTDANGCEVEAAILDVIANIGSLSNESGISIYPVPAQNILFITGDLGSSAKIVVFNALGEEVAVEVSRASDEKQYKLDISLFPSGVYFLEICKSEKMFKTTFVKN